ncbi:MAG: hypothetical protein SEPTF4163_004738 [Sporothrix epigloea]
MHNFIERIQAKLEILRLEKRYTRHRNRRSTFVSTAVYVDGEYVYQTPVSTGSSTSTTNSSVIRQTQEMSSPNSTSIKLRNRLSMPAFSSASKSPSRTQAWRTEQFSSADRQ